MQPEALLIERLLDGKFGLADESGQFAFDEVASAYAEATSNITVKLSEIDSVVTQMELLARFHDALSVADPNVKASAQRVADRLLDLAQLLRPGRARPGGRPSLASVRKARPKRATAKVARSVSGEPSGKATTTPGQSAKAAPKASKRPTASAAQKRRRKSK
jgi:hypothetical protein